MVGEIADFVSKHKGKLFTPGIVKKTETKRPGSVGELGKSLEDNDPETLKFVKRHETSIHGEKPEVATKYALDDPKNANMKPEEGVYEEMEDMEEAKGKCPKCGASECSCKQKLLSNKLKEETLANFIALDVLEELKAERLDELSKSLYNRAAKDAYEAKNKAQKPGFFSRMMGAKPDLELAAKKRSQGLKFAAKAKDPDTETSYPSSKPEKPAKRNISLTAGPKDDNPMTRIKHESVGEIHKVSPGDPDYTGGMHVHTKPKAEIQTDHKPAVSSSEKSKKLTKKEVKEGHTDPMPHLKNPETGSGCTGHEDPMPAIKKAHADPTKIPNRNQVPNSTQPKSGVLDKKKNKVEEITSEGVLNWFEQQRKKHQGQWTGQQTPPAPKPKKPKVPDGYVKAKVEKKGGLFGKLEDHQAKWMEGGTGKKKVNEAEIVDEASERKLGRYIGNAARDLHTQAHVSGFRKGLGALPPDETRERKIRNRQKGIDTAAEKLSGNPWVNVKATKNEEVIDEGKEKVEKTMHEFKHGTLHSGSKTGPKVRSRKQAIAIALSQQRKADGK